MKKTTESLPTGQVIFILGIFLCSSLIFFYLGARFGPELLKLDDERNLASTPIFPDGKIEEEIKQILARNTHEFVFHDALQDKKQLADLEMISAAQKEAQEAEQIQAALSEQKKAERDTKDLKDPSTDSTSSPQAELRAGTKDKIKKVEPQQQKAPTPAPVVVAQSPMEPLDGDLQAFASTVYHLQLGSFAEKSKAEAALALWKKRGFDGSISSSKIEGKGLWYRLELGHYTTQQDVEAAQKTVQQKYGQSTRITQSQSL